MQILFETHVFARTEIKFEMLPSAAGVCANAKLQRKGKLLLAKERKKVNKVENLFAFKK